MQQLNYSKPVAKLVSYSKPSAHFISEGLDNAQDLIAFCARVSNPANQYNTETAEKLINYLVKHQHWSPLEMVSACIEIETTRDIARQILRHRSFSFQEFSQRYADPTKDLGFVLREARLQDIKNRQNSVQLDINTDDGRRLAWQWEEMQKKVLAAAEDVYKWAIENNIAKEQARAVLPEGLTTSRLYMNGTIRSWVHFIELRSGHGTQMENQLIALECAKVISEVFPIINNYISK